MGRIYAKNSGIQEVIVTAFSHNPHHPKWINLGNLGVRFKKLYFTDGSMDCRAAIGVNYGPDEYTGFASQREGHRVFDLTPEECIELGELLQEMGAELQEEIEQLEDEEIAPSNHEKPLAEKVR